MKFDQKVRATQNVVEKTHSFWSITPKKKFNNCAFLGPVTSIITFVFYEVFVAQSFSFIFSKG